MGATSFGYDLARQFGLKVRETRPGLVPLLFAGEDGRHYSDLAGVSAEVIAACDGQRFREKMLITHRGLSGPAILQISSYWRKPASISIDLAPEQAVTAELLESVAPRNIGSLRAALRRFLPQPFCRPVAGDPSPQELDELLAAGTGAHATQLVCGSFRYRRLRQGRGNRRRRGYRRIVTENNGEPKSTRPVLHRRSSRRDGAPGRVQFSMGVGIGRQRGAGVVARPCSKLGLDGNKNWVDDLLSNIAVETNFGA